MTPGTAWPVFDLVTDTTAIMLIKRRIIGLSTALATGIRTATEQRRRLQVVTPVGSRLTPAAATVLVLPYADWIAGDNTAFYDARTGIPLHFDGTAFTPLNQRKPADAFDPIPEDVAGTQLRIGLRVRHAPVATTVLGEAIELLYNALTGTSPAGWGTSEPTASPWNPTELTRLCRDRAPTGTWLCHTGYRAQGTLRADRVTDGIDEHLTLWIGYQPGEHVPLDRLTQAIDDIAAEHHLMELVAYTQPGRPDLTVAPRRPGPRTPIGLALGPGAIHDIGPDHSAPGITPVEIGNRRNPSRWYPLDDWTHFEQLLRDLVPTPPEDAVHGLRGSVGAGAAEAPPEDGAAV